VNYSLSCHQQFHVNSNQLWQGRLWQTKGTIIELFFCADMLFLRLLKRKVYATFRSSERSAVIGQSAVNQCQRCVCLFACHCV